MSKVSKDLMGASKNLFIMALLQQRDCYGYEILEKIKELSKGKITIAAGYLYPMLNKMKESGKVKSFWEIDKSGRPRKYYKLLAKGKKSLQQEWSDLKMVSSMLKAIIEP